jgi:hypothetical protein
MRVRACRGDPRRSLGQGYLGWVRHSHTRAVDLHDHPFDRRRPTGTFDVAIAFDVHSDGSEPLVHDDKVVRVSDTSRGLGNRNVFGNVPGTARASCVGPGSGWVKRWGQGSDHLRAVI